MKQRICDRCREKIEDETKRFRIVVSRPGAKGIRGKDLCPECYEAFVDFMANEGSKKDGN